MIVAVTGTRHGMTQYQRAAFWAWLRDNGRHVSEFHEGGCVGVDYETSLQVKYGRYSKHGGGPRIHTHPGKNNGKWEATDHTHADVIHPPLSNHARNRAMVDQCDLLIVVPREMTWQESGGTWYTHDYAKEAGQQILLIRPDGTIKMFHGGEASN